MSITARSGTWSEMRIASPRAPKALIRTGSERAVSESRIYRK